MDSWVLSQLNALVEVANERIEAYDVAAVVDGVDRFVDDLSTWYLRRGRRRFARTAEPEDAAAAFSTLHECLVTLARLVAPVMPFLAEAMYQNLVRSHDPSAAESVHLTPYPVSDPSRVDAVLDREMALARAVVTLGRAARSDAAIRVRQPLPRLTIACEAAQLALSDELRAEIADELNVKQVEVADHVEAFARRVVRPNPRLLGPRLGREFPAVVAALQRGEFSLEEDGSVKVLEHRLTRDEVNIVLEPLDDQAVAQDLQLAGGLAVALDRSVTPELRAEGRARELVHRVQTMRRDAGLSVEDRILLGYQASPAWSEVLATFSERIREEVGATGLGEGDARDSSHSALSTQHSALVTWEGSLDGEPISLWLKALP
jgi:isoleucyl-tRNA synthetase